MFSIQQFFSKRDRFQELFEAAARESQVSVRLVVELIASPRNTLKLEELAQARRKEKEISDQISTELVNAFFTGLEREDIEALARGLFRIPKAAEKLAERMSMTRSHLDGLDFSRQCTMMSEAMDAVCNMIKQLRDMKDLAKIKEFNDRLQLVEVASDKYMNQLLCDLYDGKSEPLQAMAIRDIYEMMEKVVDRCHDVGNVVMYIVLKNS